MAADSGLPPARERPPTIRDVARVAGVSLGTASKALNGRGRLREETRERVRAVAEELEFRPNDLVQSLLRGRTFTVGLLTTDPYGRFSGPLLIGIEDALGAAEIMVLLCHTRDDPVRERKAIESLLAKQVDGIIVTGRRIDPRPPINLGRSRTPVVYAFAQTADPDALCLISDDAQGGRLATDHLLRAGRRRLAHITGPTHFQAVGLRQAGMVQALTERDLALPEHRALSGPWTEGWGYDAALHLLATDPAIDAIFCGSDQIARGAVEALRERGVRVPDDVAVVGFDNWQVMAEAARPPLTTIDMELHELGRLASTRLMEMVDGERATGVVKLPCRLVVRASSGVGATGETPAGDGSEALSASAGVWQTG